MKKIYIGTAGWSYKDWVGPFYPKAQSGGFDWLQFYSHYFNCVEVNSTYYSYISNIIVNGWINKVSDSDEFLFNIKLHQDFTHGRKFDNEKIKAVKFNLDLLKESGKLGGLLIQFPYSFQMNQAATDYLSRLAQIFSPYKKFVEVRHNSWNNEETKKIFSNLDLTYCTIDQPQIGKTIKFEIVKTNDVAYLRFHGRNKDAWFNSIKNFGKEQTYDQQSERYNYLYTTGELTEFAGLLMEEIAEFNEVHIVFNNHPNGQAVANALELLSILEGKNVNMPETILKNFPKLRRVAQQI